MKNLDKNVWNHNYAYNDWIKNKIGNKKRILDIGCGDGTLDLYLANDNNEILGIDPYEISINKAKSKNKFTNVNFLVSNFENFVAENNQKFDAIIFVASIHHMDMNNALIKAKSLLSPGGIIIIVGLAKPYSYYDWFIEIMRIIPSYAMSYWYRNQTSEELGIQTNYEFPNMKTIREIANIQLPGSIIEYGLYYRYLLTWVSSL